MTDTAKEYARGLYMLAAEEHREREYLEELRDVMEVFDKNPGWIEQARAHDMSINVWTVNDSTDIQRMIDFGVDCITTNEPLRVRGMLDGNEFVIK